MLREVELSHDDPGTIDVPIDTHTQGIDSEVGSISTSIVALSISSQNENSIGPMTELSVIDAASVSDSSSETEIPETSTSLPDRLGHDLLWTRPQPEGEEVLDQQASVGKEVDVSLTKMISTEAIAMTVPNITQRKRPHETWKMDTTQTTAMTHVGGWSQDQGSRW